MTSPVLSREKCQKVKRIRRERAVLRWVDSELTGLVVLHLGFPSCPFPSTSISIFLLRMSTTTVHCREEATLFISKTIYRVIYEENLSFFEAWYWERHFIIRQDNSSYWQLLFYNEVTQNENLAYYIIPLAISFLRDPQLLNKRKACNKLNKGRKKGTV